MNAAFQDCLRTASRIGLISAALVLASNGQTTLINLGTQGRNVDFTGATWTRPVKTGTTLPATCSPGDLFFNTTAPAGTNLYGCPTTNSWAQFSPGTAVIKDPGSNGIVVRTALNTATTVAAPNGAVVGTTDTQTLTNKSIASTEITGLGSLATANYPSAGLVKSSGTAFSAAGLGDVLSLWTTCTSGYLKFDGTCSTPGGTAYTNGTGLSLTGNVFAVQFGTSGATAAVGNDLRFLNATSLNSTSIASLSGLLKLASGTPSAAAAADIVALFGSGSCSGLLMSDATCVAPSTFQTALGFTPLNAALNLSDLGSAGTARTNLGLGTASTLAATTTVGSPGVDTNIPTEKAVRAAITAAGGGNVNAGGTLASGDVVIGAGTTSVQDSTKAAPVGAFVGTTDTQTLTNKSIASTEITGLGSLSTANYPAAGLVKSSGTAFSPAALGDVLSLWTSCTSGYLKFDGACSTPSGTTYTNGTSLNLVGNVFSVLFGTSGTRAAVGNDSRFLNATSLNSTSIASLSGLLKLTSGTPSAAAAADIVALFGSGSCSGLLKSDATCVAPSTFQTALGYTPLNAALNLSDLGSAGTARTNLGLGTASILAATITVGSPGVDTNIPTEKAVRAAITAAGGGNVNTGGTLASGNVVIGAGTTSVQDSTKGAPVGAFVGTTDTQTLTNKSIASSEITGLGALAAAGYPSAGLVKSSGTAFSAAALGDVLSLWTTCTSGYLKFDGTCSTPGGTTYTNGTGLSLTGNVFAVQFGTSATTAAVGNDTRFLNATSLNSTSIASLSGLLKLAAGTPSTAAATDIVALFGSGSCSGLLKSDATCVAPSTFQTALGYTPLNAALNLSDLGSAGTARTNLGLGSASTLAATTSVGMPGLDTNIPTEKAVRAAITAAGGGNVNAGGTLASGNVVIGAGTTSVQDSTKAAPVGAFVGTTDIQTLTNKSIASSEITGLGALAAAGYPSAGLVKSSGTAFSAAALGDVLSLWTTCTSGYLKFDGTCSTPSGTTYTNGTGLSLTGNVFAVQYGTSSTTAAVGNDSRFLNATSLNSTSIASLSGLLKLASGTPSAAAAADVVALFGSGSCSGLLKSDATCVAPSTFQTALGYTPLNAALNLSDLGSAGTARTNLGLGSVATLAVTTSVGTPGLDTNIPTEKAVRTAIAAAGGGNVNAGGTLASGNVVIGAGTTSVQDSTKAAPAGAFVGTTDTQTLTNKSIAASEINSGTLSATLLPAFSGDISITQGSAATTLATVNASPGTYGDSTHSLQVTVDGKGRITAIAPVAISGGGGGGGTITTGTLASEPTTCSIGTLYFATDQPAGQQIYTCSATNTWTQVVNLGPSGALAFAGGSLDINTAVVPRLAAANTFSGLNTVTGGLSLLTTSTQPACSSTLRGTFWYLNNGSSKDNVQVCVYNGSAFGWINLY